MAEALVPVYHRSRVGGCGGLALYLTHYPQVGEPVSASGFKVLVGKQPGLGDRIEPLICAACGRQLDTFEFLEDWQRWIAEPLSACDGSVVAL